MSLSFGQLEDLWKQAGGNAVYAPMAAAIAMAESGGNPSAVNHNSNGTTDRGLWQINSIHGALSTFDSLANAKAAVNISQNGTSWRPWCTAWSNARCGGTYLGDGAPYKKFLPGEAHTGPTQPSQSVPSGGGTSATLLSDPLGFSTAVDRLFARLNAGAAAITFFTLGILMMIAGVIILIMQLTGRQMSSLNFNTKNTGVDDVKTEE